MVENKIIKVCETVKVYARGNVKDSIGISHFERLKDENGNYIYDIKSVSFYIDEGLYNAIKASFDLSIEEGKKACMDLLSEEYESHLDDDRQAHHCVSMNETIYGEDGEGLESQFEDTESETPVEYAYRKEQEELVKKAIASLTGRQAEAFHYVSTKKMTKREASMVMGVTEQAVGQFYKQALTTLKKYVEKNK
jgi:DNA-directed RNA polymerase specialized sigma subunit